LYNEKVDVYSYGIILFEIITGKPPYEGPPANGKKGEEFIRGVRERGWRPTLTGIQEWIRRLLEKLMQTNPKRRGSFDDVVQTFVENKYMILPEVDQDAVQEYVNRVQKAEDSLG
jgi:serine/threonine protein kinase